MTDRDRLIELIRKSNCVSKWDYDIDDFKDPDPVLQLTDHLLANGVILPPCKVGDKIYCLFKHCDHTETEIIEVEIDAFEIHKDYTIINGYCGAHCYRYFTHEIGKTVFLTKEEAEAKLKELYSQVPSKNGWSFAIT